MADTATDLQQMSDDDLLSQINRFDPYDVEFARRFRAVSAERDRLRADLYRAANRLQWCAGLLPSNSSRDQASVWAEEARAAITTKGDADERA